MLDSDSELRPQHGGLEARESRKSNTIVCDMNAFSPFIYHKHKDDGLKWDSIAH